MRLATVALMAALVASAAESLRRLGRLGALGVLLALTPMVLFFGSAVNPSGVEIVAGLALWASGGVLGMELRSAPERADARLITRVGVAALVLTLSRQLGPLWLVTIMVVLIGLAGRSAWRALVRSRTVRIWTGIVLTAAAAQMAWVLAVGTLESSHSIFVSSKPSVSEALRLTIGDGYYRYVQMIGRFGWLETAAPATTIVSWTAALGAILAVALLFGRRRDLAAIAAVIVLVIMVPAILEMIQADEIGVTHWQGRYTLPLATGVPILAVLSIRSRQARARIGESPLLPVLGTLLVVAHVAAFAQNLRRYTVGSAGAVWYFLHPDWSPPFGPALLSALFLAATITCFVWLLASEPRDVPVQEMRA